MAVTLAHLAKIETDPLRKYVITNLLREIKVMELLPFTSVDSLKSVAVRWQTLPDVAFRAINRGYTPSEGDTEQVWEAVYALGGEIKYDRVFDKIGNTIVNDGWAVYSHGQCIDIPIISSIIWILFK